MSVVNSKATLEGLTKKEKELVGLIKRAVDLVDELAAPVSREFFRTMGTHHESVEGQITNSLHSTYFHAQRDLKHVLERLPQNLADSRDWYQQEWLLNYWARESKIDREWERKKRERQKRKLAKQLAC